ncbi:hypothetical protein AN189_12335 [Loktanella sp. 3ANDIMAR09]|nr:hypothetical protein AN189_12335 [Loktanella sp. 3ANDIMAR09]
MLSDLLIAVAGGFAGFIASVFFHAWTGRISDDQASLDELKEALSQVRQLGLNFWLVDAMPSNDEIKARTILWCAVHTTSEYEKILRRCLKADFDEYQRLDDRLFDIATGDEFESAGRKANPAIATEISVTCSKMRSMIRTRRRDLLWAH